MSSFALEVRPVPLEHAHKHYLRGQLLKRKLLEKVLPEEAARFQNGILVFPVLLEGGRLSNRIYAYDPGNYMLEEVFQQPPNFFYDKKIPKAIADSTTLLEMEVDERQVTFRGTGSSPFAFGLSYHGLAEWQATQLREEDPKLAPRQPRLVGI